MFPASDQGRSWWWRLYHAWAANMRIGLPGHRRTLPVDVLSARCHRNCFRGARVSGSSLVLSGRCSPRIASSVSRCWCRSVVNCLLCERRIWSWTYMLNPLFISHSGVLRTHKLRNVWNYEKTLTCDCRVNVFLPDTLPIRFVQSFNLRYTAIMIIYYMNDHCNKNNNTEC